MPTNKEDEFIDKIDCQFPYTNREKCFELIDEAISISANAAFTVVEEICRTPYDKKPKVSVSFLLELLENINTKFDHPLKELILPVAHKMVQDEEIPVDDAISKMLHIKNYTGQYAALSIVYFSCDDVEEKLEPVWKDIIAIWNT